MRTLISRGIVVSAAGAVQADVLIDGEQIVAVGTSLGPADQRIDAAGRYVLPGGVDVHTHLELATPNGVACDDFVTGTRAAACGGTTTIVDYAGHERGESLLAGLARWQARAAGRAHIDYAFHMMISEVNDQVSGKERPAGCQHAARIETEARSGRTDARGVQIRQVHREPAEYPVREEPERGQDHHDRRVCRGEKEGCGERDGGAEKHYEKRPAASDALRKRRKGEVSQDRSGVQAHYGVTRELCDV